MLGVSGEICGDSSVLISRQASALTTSVNPSQPERDFTLRLILGDDIGPHVRRLQRIVLVITMASADPLLKEVARDYFEGNLRPFCVGGAFAA